MLITYIALRKLCHLLGWQYLKKSTDRLEGTKKKVTKMTWNPENL